MPEKSEAENHEDTLDMAIDVCADFERKTGLKTSAIHEGTQKELALKTGLTLKDIKKWQNANRVAQATLTKIEKARE